FLPFTHALIGMRLALFQPANAAAVWHEAGVLALFSLALVPASILFFSWTVRCARQSGTLSFY
ncbi:MAG TPA: hypothetical protein VFA67_05675, partial [Candidatus Sulfotelmatobacter sp.]|nr:hypothetical protein [Candidatus Sulfotelmatobacter sp.]